MKIDYYPAKNARNIAIRKLSFERARAFDFDHAEIWQDTREVYPEERYVAGDAGCTAACTVFHAD